MGVVHSCWWLFSIHDGWRKEILDCFCDVSQRPDITQLRFAYLTSISLDHSASRKGFGYNIAKPKRIVLLVYPGLLWHAVANQYHAHHPRWHRPFVFFLLHITTFCILFSNIYSAIYCSQKSQDFSVVTQCDTVTMAWNKLKQCLKLTKHHQQRLNKKHLPKHLQTTGLFSCCASAVMQIMLRGISCIKAFLCNYKCVTWFCFSADGSASLGLVLLEISSF